jgi:hypothetical protein
VLDQEHANIAGGSGVDEFREILRDRAERDMGSPEWGMWNKDLLADATPFELDVWALSPSADAIGRGISMLVHRALGVDPMRRALDVGPNEGSVALWVRAGEVRCLLGADLEESGGERRGWTAILDGSPRRWLAGGKASLFKVAHHGSANARHDRIWTELLGDESIAVVTSYSRGKNPPPNSAERAWIRARAGSAWITTHKSVRRRRDREVERQVQAAGKRLRVSRGFGHIRARASASGSGGWSIDLFGDAVPLP